MTGLDEHRYRLSHTARSPYLKCLLLIKFVDTTSSWQLLLLLLLPQFVVSSHSFVGSPHYQPNIDLSNYQWTRRFNRRNCVNIWSRSEFGTMLHLMADISFSICSRHVIISSLEATFHLTGRKRQRQIPRVHLLNWWLHNTHSKQLYSTALAKGGTALLQDSTVRCSKSCLISIISIESQAASLRSFPGRFRRIVWFEYAFQCDSRLDLGKKQYVIIWSPGMKY